jgi:hypothetical protein
LIAACPGRPNPTPPSPDRAHADFQEIWRTHLPPPVSSPEHMQINPSTLGLRGPAPGDSETRRAVRTVKWIPEKRAPRPGDGVSICVDHLAHPSRTALLTSRGDRPSADARPGSGRGAADHILRPQPPTWGRGSLNTVGSGHSRAEGDSEEKRMRSGSGAARRTRRQSGRWCRTCDERLASGLSLSPLGPTRDAHASGRVRGVRQLSRNSRRVSSERDDCSARTAQGRAGQRPRFSVSRVDGLSRQEEPTCVMRASPRALRHGNDARPGGGRGARDPVAHAPKRRWRRSATKDADRVRGRPDLGPWKCLGSDPSAIRTNSQLAVCITRNQEGEKR